MVLAVGRYGTDKPGYAEMLAAGRKYPERVWAIEGCNGRKTDPVDVHSVATVSLRTPNLVQVHVDPELVVMGMLVDRRDELGRARTQTINGCTGCCRSFSQAGQSSSCPRTRPAR